MMYIIIVLVICIADTFFFKPIVCIVSPKKYKDKYKEEDNYKYKDKDKYTRSSKKNVLMKQK